MQEYKRLMRLRLENPAVRRGTLVSYVSTDAAIFTRKTEGNEVLVIANTRSSSRTLTLPQAIQNTVWADASTGEAISLGTTRSIQAYGYLILKRG